MRAVALSLAFLALSACMGEATFDASSDAAIKESAEQISADLTEDERDEFQKAFMYFSLGGADGLALGTSVLAAKQITKQERVRSLCFC